MESKVLIVPGYRGSGPAHWQSWLQKRVPGSERVAGIDWDQPQITQWSARIGDAIDSSSRPVWVVAHSFGCLASAVAIGERSKKVAGAILVAPADPGRFSLLGVRRQSSDETIGSIKRFLPQRSLGVSGLVIASENDPWIGLDQARHWAECWGFSLYNVRQAGHINTESGFGPWPLLLDLVNAMRQETAQPAINARIAKTRQPFSFRGREASEESVGSLVYL